MAFGSSFFHASQTEVGWKLDLKTVDLVLWIMYQEAVADVEPVNVTYSVTNEKNETETRNASADDIIRDLAIKPRFNQLLFIFMIEFNRFSFNSNEVA